MRIAPPDAFPDRHVELLLTKRASIERVFQEMHQVDDDHTMCRTLRAVPLADNSLRRRSNSGIPANWVD